MAKVDPPEAKQGFPSMDPPSVMFPTSVIAQSEIWDERTRDGLAKPRFKKRDLDARRADNLVPGTPLKPTQQDARVPVLLIQRSVESSSPGGSVTTSATTPGIHGWTLLVPNGWGMPFLSSLLFTGSRVGGLRERAVQAFESGVPSFPADAVDTDAYADEVEKSAEEQQARWERTPPAKRVNYEEREIDDPWRPDWHGVLGLESGFQDEEEEFVTAQREPAAAPEGNDNDMAVDPQRNIEEQQSLRPWILRGQDIPTIIATVSTRLQPPSELFLQLARLRRKRGLDQLAISKDDAWRSALIRVRFEMCGRGRPTEGAMVFAIDDDETKAWVRLFASRGKINEDTLESADEMQVCGAMLVDV
jgi:ribonuclease P/MRP protein subunit POP1